MVINVRNGDYEVGESESETWLKLREPRPDAFIWVERVGYPIPFEIAATPGLLS